MLAEPIVIPTKHRRLDVTVTAFFNESESPPIAALLDRYAFSSQRVELRYVDPNAEPAALSLSALFLAVYHGRWLNIAGAAAGSPRG